MSNLFPLSAADLYKPGHTKMYHPKTEVIFSNFTPRGDSYFTHYAPNAPKGIIVAGVQRMINFVLGEMWEEFFLIPEDEAVAKYKRRMDGSLGKDMVDVSGVRKLHKLGYLPIEFRSQDEGILSPLKVPVFTIHNTHPDFFWLTNYLETVISAESWKTFTSATTAFNFRLLAEEWAAKTCDNKGHIPFQMHDFSLRGLSCIEDGYKSGIGHLFSFMGTDNIPAIESIEDNYPTEATKSGETLAAYSVPATEHSVSTTNINKNISDVSELINGKSGHGMNQDDSRFWGEVKFLKRYLTEIVPTGIASYVADSYDYYRIISEASKELKDVIMERDGKLVFRPDTGKPEDVVCGIKIVKVEGETFKSAVEEYWEEFLEEENYPLIRANIEYQGKYFEVVFDFTIYSQDYAVLEEIEVVREISKAEAKGSIETLWEIFGGAVNDKGYKELDPHVGLIYGDSITMSRAQEIFKRLEAKGFASNNVVFGLGSFVYSYVTRDTFGFAMKATGTIIDGKSIPVSKDPKGDSGKKSANGFLKVVNNEGILTLVESDSLSVVEDEDNTLKVRFRDGAFINKTDIDVIRSNVDKEVYKVLNKGE